MINEHDRDQLLAYLYGALEDDERAALEGRLAAESDLRAALDAARAQQALLADAAGLPADDVVLDPRTARGRIFTLRGIQIAASILFVATALGLGFRVAARSSHENAQPVVTATGPAAFAPGGAFEYVVRATDIGGDPVAARVEARLVDGKGEVRATATSAVDRDGAARLAFDPDAARPGEEYRLHIAATFPGDARRPVALETTVRDATRVMTRLATDKPVYRPGDTIRIRGVALESLRLLPAGDVPLHLALTDPRGGVVFERDLQSATGVAAWEFALPADAVGGAYRLALGGVTGDEGLVAPSALEIPVRAYRVPRLVFDVALDRDSYGPGDEGRAWVTVERVEGGAPSAANVTTVLHVDGRETQRQSLRLDGRGALSVPFRVPREVREGRVRLSLSVDDGGTVEGFSETIPVALHRVDVELYPEGGELVAGLPSRVYFRATTPSGDPAGVAFHVEDDGGVVASAQSAVRGMGSFEMTPGAGLTYRVTADDPSGPEIACDVPAVRAQGVVLRALDEVTPAGAAVRIRLASPRGGAYVVSAWIRGTQVATESVTLRAGTSADVALRATTDAGGVVRVTVQDDSGTPLAERLVSRAAPRTLDVTASTERDRYGPRERVKVTVTVRDGAGSPAAAILGAGVLDEGVMALGAGGVPLPLHFLLGMEVDELEDAQLYADGRGAARAVDLLLGVQGWRRFAWRDAATFVAEHPEKGPRVVGVAASELPVSIDNADAARARVQSAMRRVDRGLGQGALLGGLAFLLASGIVIGVRATVRRRPWAAAGGFAVPGALVLLVVAAVINPAREQERVVGARMAEDAQFARGALELGAPEETAAAQEDAPAAAAADDVAFEFPDDWDDDWDGVQAEREAQADAANRLSELRRLVQREQLEEEIADGRGFVADAAVDDFVMIERKPLVLTREYAHVAAPWTGERDDFSEVLYWRPLLVTDEQGTASFEFDTSDAITRFRIAIDAHDARGALGAGTTLFESRMPFYAEPKLPLEVAAGDEIIVPVTLVSDSDAATDVFVTAEIDGGLVRVASERALPGTRLTAGGRGRVTLPLTVGQGSGTARLRLIASAENGLRDVVTRSIAVVPRGYPITVARSGTVMGDADGPGTATATFVLPEAMDAASLRGGLRVYPSTLATLVDGLDGLLGEPRGCFEQASSTNYPNVLALNYLREQDVVAPAVAARARGLLADGYAKLTGYECGQRGYEWFGADPANEALTAYGVLEFADMAKVHDVDPAMVQRTRLWLLDRRDGDGGFVLEDRSLDTFGGAPRELTEAYILWALTEAGDTADLSAELDVLAARARASDDPYLIALAANVFAKREMPQARELIERLASLQEPGGSLPGAATSITSSRGKNLMVETASLAALAFDRSPVHLANAESAVRYVLAQRENGRFGATQATILALKAITSHAAASRTTSVDHDLEVIVNGEHVATRHVAAGTPGVIEFGDEVRARLVRGENTIELRASGDEALPWAATFAFHALVPATSEACPITVTTSLSTETAAEGDSVELTATVTNTEARPQGMVLARVGFPAGLEPRTQRLDELQTAGAIDFYEIRPREVTLYWRGMAASESKTVAIDLTAAIPGRYEGPATSAYLYYGDDAKRWAAPLTIEIDAARNR